MRSCLSFVIFKHLRLYGFYLLSVSPNLNPTVCGRVHRDLNLAAVQEQSLGLVLLPQAADVHLFSHSLGRGTLRPYSRSHAGCHEGAPGQDALALSYSHPVPRWPESDHGCTTQWCSFSCLLTGTVWLLWVLSKSKYLALLSSYLKPILTLDMFHTRVPHYSNSIPGNFVFNLYLGLSSLYIGQPYNPVGRTVLVYAYCIPL